MPFQKGRKKTGGNVKGSEHKTTKDIKEAYRLLIEKNLDNLTLWLERVAEKDAEKAIKIMAELSEYVIPKLSRTDVTSDNKPIKSPFEGMSFDQLYELKYGRKPDQPGGNEGTGKV